MSRSRIPLAGAACESGGVSGALLLTSDEADAAFAVLPRRGARGDGFAFEDDPARLDPSAPSRVCGDFARSSAAVCDRERTRDAIVRALGMPSR